MLPASNASSPLVNSSGVMHTNWELPDPLKRAWPVVGSTRNFLPTQESSLSNLEFPFVGAGTAYRMSTYDGEQILVIPRSFLDELGNFQGLTTETERYIPTLLDPANNFFMDREAAEEDPSHKQIIPYTLFRFENRYLHYVRGKSGGERRLHAQGSLGIGGHINPVDEREGHLGHETYMAGVEREIEEELILKSKPSQRVVALLNDDSNTVGQVHLGVVHLFELADDCVSAREDALHNLQFRTIEELRGPLYQSLESWTRFCVDALDRF